MVGIRVAAHVHSAWSYDGSWELPDLAKAFRRRGYDALLMAEHDHGFSAERWRDYRAACAAASTPSILLVPGIEYGDGDNVVHIPVWGDVPFLGNVGDTARLLRRAREAEGFTAFAHPWRRDAWRRFDEDWLTDLSAVEIWNRKYDGFAPHREAVHFAERHGLRPMVSLDFHNRRQFFPLAMSMQVEGAVTRESVYEALRSGQFEPRLRSRSALLYTNGVRGLVVDALEAARKHAARALRRIESRVRQ